MYFFFSLLIAEAPIINFLFSRVQSELISPSIALEANKEISPKNKKKSEKQEIQTSVLINHLRTFWRLDSNKQHPADPIWL